MAQVLVVSFIDPTTRETFFKNYELYTYTDAAWGRIKSDLERTGAMNVCLMNIIDIPDECPLANKGGR